MSHEGINTSSQLIDMELFNNERCNVMVSIIVPVYNVKVYLNRCIESLINQTYNDFEIILVDDGSTDGSGDLCDQYEKSHDFVHVIHKNNGGLSSARNAGIKQAKGEYLLFVDSDDYIEKQSLEKLIHEAEKNNCDIVCANAYKVSENSCVEKAKRRQNLVLPCDGLTFVSESIKQGAMLMCAPFALYKKDLILHNSIFFEEGIFHEDELWTPQVYLKAKSVSYIDYVFYYHWFREGSIMNSGWNEKHTKDIFYICETLYSIYKAIENKKIRWFMDRVGMLYLNAANLSQCADVNRALPFKSAKSIKNRIKGFLFMVSPKIYYAINNALRRIK